MVGMAMKVVSSCISAQLYALTCYLYTFEFLAQTRVPRLHQLFE